MGTVVIVGAGAAGLHTAFRLQHTHDVTLIESDSRLGGHAHSVFVEGFALDTAFIIFNTLAYPRFYKWMDELGVSSHMRDADMSMTFFDRAESFYFAGRKGIGGVFAQPKNALRPWFWSFMREVQRFKNEAYSDFQCGRVGTLSLQGYLDKNGYSADFAKHFLFPMAAAVWSIAGDDLRAFSAATLIRFLGHHALLKAQGAKWQTFQGGSIAYVEAFKRAFKGRVILGRRAVSTRRDDSGTRLTLDDGSTLKCDHLVLATHADQALSLLDAPTADEQKMLGAWRYSQSRVLLHSDESLLPQRRDAWSSWNITTEGNERAISYDLVHIQKPNTDRDYFVSLGSEQLLQTIATHKIHKELSYRHPIIDNAARATQDLLRQQRGVLGTWFAGGYCGDGFHEDAISASQVVVDGINATRAEVAA